MTRKLKEFVNQAGPKSSDPYPVNVGENHVSILLALYNGAATFGAQLESIAAQSHSDWSLIVSDDGSEDDWVATLLKFSEQNKNNTWIANGPRKGFARNFMSLACLAGPMVPYIAFCDQDDVWSKNKLARAVAHLRSVPSGIPALYASRTMICDSELTPLRPSPLFKRQPGFKNALVQSIGGGNTMVMNRAALDILQDSANAANSIVSHDWWAYQLISGAGGRIFYDLTPTVLYRQHDGNLIGSNDGWVASFGRILRLFKGHFRDWNTDNIKALEKSRHWLTDDAQKTLDLFSQARSGSFLTRLAALRQSGVQRQTKRGTCALWIAAVFKKL